MHRLIMIKRTWQQKPPKSPSKPKFSDELKAKLLLDVAPIVARLKKRYCKNRSNSDFNWPEDLFARWHRDALYFVVVMRTPHGPPETFETHAARMEHVGDGKFNIGVPMRRGWMTIEENLPVDKCLDTLPDVIHF